MYFVFVAIQRKQLLLCISSLIASTSSIAALQVCLCYYLKRWMKMSTPLLLKPEFSSSLGSLFISLTVNLGPEDGDSSLEAILRSTFVFDL
ncbi:hypothetical protein AAC387_Pa07g2626 [Persea americana]